MWKTKRKGRLANFDLRTRIVSSLILLALFGDGIVISSRHGVSVIGIYLALWILSYIVIFAGTCRYCVYYGKSCPVPLEGGCVHYLFEYGGEKFGLGALFWASVAYVLRICVPILIIVNDELWLAGGLYMALFVAFWMVHLLVTGCPNCLNRSCILNPDFNRYSDT